MYVTRAVDGSTAIEKNGQSVLSVCGENWDFAIWLCALLNELGHKSELLVNDPELLKPMGQPFGRKVHHV